MSDIEATLSRIIANKSVRVILLCNTDGKVLRKVVNEERKDDGDNFAKVLPQLVVQARNTIRDLDSLNELTFLRIKSRNYEIMVSPDKDFLVIVIQDTKIEKKESEQP